MITGQLHSLRHDGDAGIDMLLELVLETIELGLPAVKIYEPEYYQRENLS